MGREKSPAFQFYPADWLASQRVSMMTLAEEGAYVRLLGYCWRDGSIPADPASLAKLLRKGGAAATIPVVITMFTPDANDPTRLVHDRLDEERRRQADWSAKSAAGGRKSAETRWGYHSDAKASGPASNRATSNGGVTTLTRVVLPNGNSSSSSSSASSFSSASPEDKSTPPTPLKGGSDVESPQHPKDTEPAELLAASISAWNAWAKRVLGGRTVEPPKGKRKATLLRRLSESQVDGYSSLAPVLAATERSKFHCRDWPGFYFDWLFTRGETGQWRWHEMLEKYGGEQNGIGQTPGPNRRDRRPGAQRFALSDKEQAYIDDLERRCGK